MAVRMRKRHQDDVRSKIQVSAILTRLTKHFKGEVELSSTQLKSAQLLLDKSLPSLQSIEHSGQDGGPLSIEIVRFGQSKTA